MWMVMRTTIHYEYWYSKRWLSLSITAHSLLITAPGAVCSCTNIGLNSSEGVAKVMEETQSALTARILKLNQVQTEDYIITRNGDENLQTCKYLGHYWTQNCTSKEENNKPMPPLTESSQYWKTENRNWTSSYDHMTPMQPVDICTEDSYEKYFKHQISWHHNQRWPV